MAGYLGKKIAVYLVTFVLAVTINFVIPRMMPGNPIQLLLSRFSGMEGGREIIERQLTLLFNLDDPLIVQYIDFWKSIFTGDFGISIMIFPTPVIDIIKRAIVYDIVLIVPAIILGWIVGNNLGAISGVNRRVDNATMPVFYALTSSPYFWLAGVVAFFLGVVLDWFPISGTYRRDDDSRLQPAVHTGLPEALGVAFSLTVPGRPRRLGDRDAELDHIREKFELLEVHGGAWGIRQTDPQLRL